MDHFKQQKGDAKHAWGAGYIQMDWQTAGAIILELFWACEGSTVKA